MFYTVRTRLANGSRRGRASVTGRVNPRNSLGFYQLLVQTGARNPPRVLHTEFPASLVFSFCNFSSVRHDFRTSSFVTIAVDSLVPSPFIGHAAVAGRRVCRWRGSKRNSKRARESRAALDRWRRARQCDRAAVEGTAYVLLLQRRFVYMFNTLGRMGIRVHKYVLYAIVRSLL